MPSDIRPSNRPDVAPDGAEVAVALAAIALGLAVFAGCFWIDLGTGYDRIGPRFFPFVVSGGLVLSGAWLLWGALRREQPSGEGARPKTLWPAVGTFVVALGSTVLLLERAGFIPTAALLFWLVTRAFDSRRPWRDLLIGLCLTGSVYLAFTRGLGLVLPQGLLDGLL